MSLLDVIRIAEPCTEAWSSMTGDERARDCRKCDKTVFDLSVLTRAEAEALLAAKGANMCGRYVQRPDGAIVLADCLVTRKPRLATVAVVAAALVGGALLSRGDTEAVAIDDIALPDDTQATLPTKEVDTQLEGDELANRQRMIEAARSGGFLGTISFEAGDLGRVLGNVEGSE